MRTSTAPLVLLTAALSAGCVTEPDTTRCHLIRGNGHQPVVTAWDVAESECAGNRVLESVDKHGRVSSLRFVGERGPFVAEAHFPTAVDFEYQGDGVTVSYPGHDLAPILYRFQASELIECRVLEPPGTEAGAPGPARCLEIADLDYSRAKIGGVAPLAWGYVPSESELPVDARLAELDFAARCHLFEVVDGEPQVTRWDESPVDCRGRYITERADDAGRIRVVEFREGNGPWESASFPASFRFTYSEEGLGVTAANAEGVGVDASSSSRFSGRYQLRNGQLERCTFSSTGRVDSVESCRSVSELNAALERVSGPSAGDNALTTDS